MALGNQDDAEAAAEAEKGNKNQDDLDELVAPWLVRSHVFGFEFRFTIPCSGIFCGFGDWAQPGPDRVLGGVGELGEVHRSAV